MMKLIPSINEVKPRSELFSANLNPIIDVPIKYREKVTNELKKRILRALNRVCI